MILDKSQHVPVDVNIFNAKELQTKFASNKTKNSILESRLKQTIQTVFDTYFYCSIDALHIIQNSKKRDLYLKGKISKNTIKIIAKGPISTHIFEYCCSKETLTVNGWIADNSRLMLFVKYVCLLLNDLKSGNAKMFAKRQSIFKNN